MIRVDHRQHLGETLSNACNPFCWISEWKLVPRHKLHFLAHHVYKVFLARCAREAAQRFLAEHRIFFVFAVTLAHQQAVQVLELALVELESLLGFGLVCKLFRHCFDDLIESVLKKFLEFTDGCGVGLLVEIVLHLLHPTCIVVLELVELVFKLSKSAIKFSQKTVVYLSS